MSTVKRIISGSAAAWVTLVVSLFSQIATVPIYLSYWTPSQYGLWLGLISLISLFHIIDTGHQQFVGFEFLKIGVEDPASLSRTLSATIPYAFLIGVAQIISVLILVNLGLFYWLFSSSVSELGTLVIDAAGGVLILHIMVFGLLGSIGGILVRVLYPLGFYPRMAWWGVASAFGSALVPATVVVFGGGIWEAGVSLAMWVAVYNIFLYTDMLVLLKRSSIYFNKPDFRLGLTNLWKSQILVITALLDVARTVGVRIVLAPLAGAVNLAAFVTMRTGANIALKGLATITNPLMPELMRVLRQRDQARSEAAFAMVWIVLAGIMAPAVVVLQAVVEPLFIMWTRGQIDFDPLLFGLLSLSVLVFAWAQPSMAVVTGNNLLRPQLIIAIVSAVVVVAGMAILIPLIGILGVGVVLLAAELYAANRFRVVAERWLRKNELKWPRHSASRAAFSVWVAALAIVGLVFLPDMRQFVLIGVLFVLGANLFFYWRSLPLLVQERAKSILGKLHWDPRAA